MGPKIELFYSAAPELIRNDNEPSQISAKVMRYNETIYFLRENK